MSRGQAANVVNFTQSSIAQNAFCCEMFWIDKTGTIANIP
jgi:hypothetical protein